MTNKQITLTEKDFRYVLKEAVKEVVKVKLNEGFADRKWDELWIEAERQLGSENMLQEVYNYFDGDQLRDFLKSVDNDYDLGLFEDEVDDEELDADEPFDWQEYKG